MRLTGLHTSRYEVSMRLNAALFNTTESKNAAARNVTFPNPFHDCVDTCGTQPQTLATCSILIYLQLLCMSIHNTLKRAHCSEPPRAAACITTGSEVKQRRRKFQVALRRKRRSTRLDLAPGPLPATQWSLRCF